MGPRSSGDIGSATIGGPRRMGELATLPGDAPERESADGSAEATIPERFGRFTVQGVLGRGGMSTVFEAHDASLDREIALKVLHRGTGSSDSSRLRREAQALARLSHPHVVQVYEVGEVDGQTYIAMELVRGQTLQAWQAQRPPWRECVELYLQAGRGLAAAHAVGLVHRDFKPSNCIVDEQRQVRVLDFGLARGHLEPPPRTGDAGDPRISADAPWSMSLTQTGAVLGTLAYMPLEQLHGERADERSDQFSLCVSLYEAVYGERPFEGTSIVRLKHALTDGTIRPPPAGAVVPARLRRILVRGLATEPEDRWPSLDALLGALSRLLAPRRIRWVVLSLGVGLTVLGGGLWHQARAGTVCQGAEDQLVGVWDEERAEQVRAALVATAVPYAPDTWARVRLRLDDYAEAWVQGHRDACEATHRGGSQTEAVMNLRMTCLSARNTALREAVEVLARADGEVAERAVAIAAGLPGLTRCADVHALQAEVPPPEDPAVAQRVHALRERLAEVRALMEANRLDRARAEVDAIGPEVEALDYAPLQAEQWWHRGEVLGSQGRYAEAEAELTRAYALAVEHGHERIEARTSERLLQIVGHQARYAEAQQWGITAMAQARRRSPAAVARTLYALGEVLLARGEHAQALDHYQRALAIRERELDADDPALAQTLEGLGQVLRAQARYDEALEHLARALAIQTRAFGEDHPQRAVILGALAAVFEEQGRYDEALEYLRQVLVIRERAFGPRHPSVAAALANLGVTLRSQGKLGPARDAYQRALEIFVPALGEDHPNVVGVRINLGVVLQQQERYDEALEQFRRSVDPLVASVGADHPNVAIVMDNIGAVLQQQERYDEALEHHRKALAIKERVLEPDHPDLGRSLGNIGRALMEQGQYAAALEHQRRALEIFEQAWGPEHPSVGQAVLHMALTQRARGRRAEARTLAERALTVFSVGQGTTKHRAEATFMLAQCLWDDDPGARARAVDLARKAQVIFRELDAPPSARLAELDDWMQQRGIEGVSEPSVRSTGAPSMDAEEGTGR